MPIITHTPGNNVALSACHIVENVSAQRYVPSVEIRKTLTEEPSSDGRETLIDADSR